MGNWKEVVADQLKLLNLPPNVLTGFYFSIGLSKDAYEKDEQQCEELKIINSLHSGAFLKKSLLSEYEFPAMRMISSHVKAGIIEDDDYVLYFHTKGVSIPTNIRAQKWRVFMNLAMLKYLPKRIKELEETGMDLNGVNWSDWAGIEHFSGNFWLTRGAYIKSLPDFDVYNQTKRANFEKSDRDYRFNAEFWIGASSRKPYKVISQYMRNSHWPWYDAKTWDIHIEKYRKLQEQL